ncbi:MAG: shikimate dehydrogenase family protein [Bacteroidota bacterium]
MRVFGLIGYPLTHSFSGTYFNKKFLALGLTDHVYQLFPRQDLTDLKTWALGIEGLAGLNITIPHKKSVIPYLDEIRLPNGLHACNCIHIENGQLIGYNTDVIGFSKSLEPLLKPVHTRALVLGQGGAAEAVRYVLRQRQIPFLTVGRTQKHEQELLYDELTEEIIEQHPLIINTTPLGTSPKVDECAPIPYEGIGNDHILYDLVYNPAKTMFLHKGEERGATICNGWEMLVLQAEASWSIWNGLSI